MTPWIGLGQRQARRMVCRKSPRFDTAAKLLEHGELTQPEFREITGWKDTEVEYVLHYMAKDGVVEKIGTPGRYVYRLAE